MFCFSAVYDFFVRFLFVTQTSREPRNGFAPNLQGKRAWSLARTSLNVKIKVKGQGHQEQKSGLSTAITPGSDGLVRPMEWNTLAANNVIQQQMGPHVKRCCYVRVSRSYVREGNVCSRDGQGSKLAGSNPAQPTVLLTQPNPIRHCINFQDPTQPDRKR